MAELFSLLLTCTILNPDSPHGGLFEDRVFSEIILGWGLNRRRGLNRLITITKPFPGPIKNNKGQTVHQSSL